MILIDACALVALNYSNDEDHSRCVDALALMPGDQKLITTLSCVTKAMHFLGKAGGYAYQSKIWDMIESNQLILHKHTPAEATRMAQLMQQYADIPMDLADASVIAAAETLDIRQVFTIDKEFYIYRLSDGAPLEAIPGPRPIW